MVKIILITLLTISFAVINYANGIESKGIGYGPKQENNIEFKYGVAIQNGKALYIDPHELEGVALIAMSEKSIKNSKTEILKDSPKKLEADQWVLY